MDAHVPQDGARPRGTEPEEEPRRSEAEFLPPVENIPAAVYQTTNESGEPKQEALGESETRYRALVEQVPALVYIDSNDALPRSLYVSPQITDIVGMKPEEFMEDPELCLRTIHADDRERVLEGWGEAVRTGEPHTAEYRLIATDGREVWVHDSTVLIRDDEGRARYWQGLIQDITREKLAEQRLQESEGMYRALVENVPAVVYIVAPDGIGTTRYVSPQVERVLGYTQAEWLEQPDIWMELLHPDDREIVLADHDLHDETGEPWNAEYRLIAADGRAIWFRDDATLVRDDEGRPLFWEGVRLDISEQKRAEDVLRTARDELDRAVRLRTHELEEANEMMMLEIAERKATEERLRRAEQKHRTLVEQIPGAAVYVWNVDTDHGTDATAYMSPAIEALLGFTVDEWYAPPGSFWLTRVHPDDEARVRAHADRSARFGEPFDLEYRYLAKDGSIVWVHDTCALMERKPNGMPKLMHGVMVDITERKESEERLREMEQRYRALIEQIPAIVYLEAVEPTGRRATKIVFVSPQVEEILGYAPEEMIEDPNHLERLIHPDDYPAFLEADERSNLTGEPFFAEYRVRTRDGRDLWLQSRAVLVRDEEGNPRFWHGFALDITDRKRAEAEVHALELRLLEAADPAAGGSPPA